MSVSSYYAIVIVLIVFALAVQVVVGFLAIFITHTRNYHKKFRDDMCSEFTALWCRCFFRDRKHPLLNGVDNPGLDVSVPEVEIGKKVPDDGLRNGLTSTGDRVLTSPTVTKNGIGVIATDINECITSVCAQLMQAKLAAIEAEAEWDSLNFQLEKETKRRRDVTITLEAATKEAGSSDVTENTEKTKQEQRESEKRVAELNEGIAACDATIRRVEILRRQDKLLAGYDDNSLEQHVLKKVSFWQNVINYLLYIVFVCNIFITGLGVTGHHGETSGGPGGN